MAPQSQGGFEDAAQAERADPGFADDRGAGRRTVERPRPASAVEVRIEEDFHKSYRFGEGMVPGRNLSSEKGASQTDTVQVSSFSIARRTN